jgi:hypothetical protein
MKKWYLLYLQIDYLIKSNGEIILLYDFTCDLKKISVHEVEQKNYVCA